MNNLKNKFNQSITGLATAGTVLVGGAGTFGIISIIAEATGITIPKWLAYVLLAAGGVAAIVSALASYGVTIPESVALLIEAASSTSA